MEGWRRDLKSKERNKRGKKYKISAK